MMPKTKAGPRGADTGRNQTTNSSGYADPVQDLLSRLDGVKKNGNGWVARCPAHNDRNPSLSVGRGDDGRALVRCFAGCLPKDIVSAIGMDLKDLYASDGGNSSAPRTKTTSRKKFARTYATIAEAIASLLQTNAFNGARLTRYDYSDEFAVLRFDFADGSKTFRPIHRSDNRWAIGDPSGKLPLYHLAELGGTERAYVVEGEKAVDAARLIGLCATTSAHGAKSAKRSDWSPLAGMVVFILRDNNEAGKVYAEDVARILAGLGCTVRIVLLPDLPDGGDIVDFIEARDSRDDDDLRIMVETIASETPVWQPTAMTSEVSEPVEPRLAWEPFPTHALPEPVASYVKDFARDIGCDESYLALSMLPTLASCIGTTHSVRIKRNFFQPSILWAAFIGESGTRKDAVINAATGFMLERETEAHEAYQAALEEYETALTQWKDTHKTWKKDGLGEEPKHPIAPICRRCRVDDITAESLACVLEQNKRGLLLSTPELATWFGSMDAYRSGRGSDAAKWLSLYDAQMLQVDRKDPNRPRVFVPHAAVSIIGGVQPQVLRKLMTRLVFESGLASRFWFAWPPETNVNQLSDFEAGEQIQDQMATVYRRLLDLEHDADGTPHTVKLTNEAWTLFRDFICGEHTADIESSTGDLRAAYAKENGRLARLALILHMIKVVRAEGQSPRDRDKIDYGTMEESIWLIRWFKRETQRVYQTLFIGGDEPTADQTLLDFIKSKGRTITVRDLQRGPRRFRDTADVIRERLDELVRDGLGVWEYPPPGSEGGRSPETFRLTGDTTGGLKAGDTGDGDTTTAGDRVSGGSVTVASVATPTEHVTNDGPTGKN